MKDSGRSPVVAENPEGRGPFVILCDHASNRVPEAFQSFGFAEDALQTHIAWDPGALEVARILSAKLDAPLFWPDASRLIIDCNRAAGCEQSYRHGKRRAPGAGQSRAERGGAFATSRQHPRTLPRRNRRLPHAPHELWTANGADRHPLLHPGLFRQGQALAGRHPVRRRSPPRRSPDRRA